MTTSPPRPIRLNSLFGLGFVAVCMVLISHIGISLVLRVDPSAQTLWSYDYHLGVMGFTFCFVLTGFALTWVHRADSAAGAFWRQRVAQVFPVHVLVLTAAILLSLSEGVALSAWRTVAALFLVQDWIPEQGAVLTGNPNGPTWALSCALLFYALFPWLNRAARRIRPESLWAWTGGVVLALVAVPFVARLLPAEPLLVGTADSWPQTWFFGYLPVSRLLEFLLGMFVALMVSNKRWRGPGVTVSVLLSAAGLAASTQLLGEKAGFATTAVPLALLIAAVASREARGERTAFAAKPMVALGGIAFSAYVVHWIVISYGPIHAVDQASWALPLTLGSALGRAALTFGGILLIGWLLTVIVERPSVRLLGRTRPAVAQLRGVSAADVSKKDVSEVA